MTDKTAVDMEAYLMKQDKTMRRVISVLDKPPISHKKYQPFDALTKTVISQQLSNVASITITKRLVALHGRRPFKARQIISISDEQLRGCGISGNKIKAIKGLAQASLRNELSLKSFSELDDEMVIKKLISYWGIGTWTAQIFMMFCLKRQDVFAYEDVGLQRAHKLLYPNAASLEVTAQIWRPFRARAAVYLWRFLENPDLHERILRPRS
jgi:DNA-3-methyladenine glycosylase II